MEVVKVADFRSPLLVSNGQNILKRDFSPGFALKLMLKDAGLIERLVTVWNHPFRLYGLPREISNRPLRLASEKRTPPP
jgi:3-hydroxyisobutyrate dehydrogenase-like beta-hydroxyacid dehydrogenase